ncbi:uncharacterized protein N7511_001680 [Penicillium nucicola]|uniref:uncharacterized protein n=1 Tax=Penicillium nucicola TaxID=1850975 RepID=UPI00254554CB|nr:uncharacterized protein N7511_001680 [Penicillium nucicola]KAJ5776669.1 hypothetical protein N7511_001680 [Penicillium nucicola]
MRWTPPTFRHAQIHLPKSIVLVAATPSFTAVQAHHHGGERQREFTPSGMKWRQYKLRNTNGTENFEDEGFSAWDATAQTLYPFVTGTSGGYVLHCALKVKNLMVGFAMGISGDMHRSV